MKSEIKNMVSTFPEVWEFKFETEEELKVVGDFITNSLKNGVDYANCSKIGGWVSHPDFGCGRKKGAVRISFEQFKERYMTDIPKEDCSKTSERDIFNTNLLNEAKRRYPVGTLFSSAYQGDECIVVELFFKEDKNYGRAIQNSKGGWVYCDGNGWADIKALPKDFVPEYIECIEGSKKSDYITGKIYKVPKDGRIPTEGGYIPMNAYKNTDSYYGFKFKPSTKEAFDAQNQPRQPLKQAVHCTTQEEWDFVTEKLGNDGENWFIDPNWGNNKSFCISFEDKNQSQTLDFYQNAGYQILSFQEWCDLNGYKMEKEVKFEVGKWYWFAISSTINSFFRIIKCSAIESDRVRADYWLMNQDAKIGNKAPNAWVLNGIYSLKELSIEEIQQYLPDGHPDKIKVDREFKVGDWVYFMGSGKSIVNTLWQPGKILQIKCIIRDSLTFHGCSNYTEGFRHATPEEINNHLISIGQIPAGEPLNNGIEPNKDGMFKYKQTMPGASWSGGTIDNHLDVMIQSKTQSEIEFNYLPEPK